MTDEKPNSAMFESDEPERQPEPDLGVDDDTPAPDPDAFFVTRDEEGNLNTVWQDAKEYGQILVRPMTYGHVERYFGDAGSMAEAGPDIIAEVIRNHVIDPDFEAHARQTYGADYERRGYENALNERVIRDEMQPLAPMRLLTAIFRASGMDPDVVVDSQGEATIEFEGDEGNPNK